MYLLILFICSYLGIYPDCECGGENDVFSSYLNQCYVECGVGAIGLHPYCRCEAPRMYYETDEFTCKSNFGRECPPQSIGIGPDCLCAEQNKVFFENFWNCYTEGLYFGQASPSSCPDKSQKYPQCSGIDRNALLSLIG